MHGDLTDNVYWYSHWSYPQSLMSLVAAFDSFPSILCRKTWIAHPVFLHSVLVFDSHDGINWYRQICIVSNFDRRVCIMHILEETKRKILNAKHNLASDLLIMPDVSNLIRSSGKRNNYRYKYQCACACAGERVSWRRENLQSLANVNGVSKAMRV